MSFFRHRAATQVADLLEAKDAYKRATMALQSDILLAEFTDVEIKTMDELRNRNGYAGRIEETYRRRILGTDSSTS